MTRRRPDWSLLVNIAVIGLTVGGLRLLNIETAYELFHDEATYSIITEGFRSSGRLEFDGFPFFLHPPLFFLVGAAVAPFTSGDNIVEQVMAQRVVTVGFAAVSGIGLFLLLRRTASNAVGLLAVLVFALDPFIVRFDSRVMLETMAMCFTVLGLLAVSTMLDEEPTWPNVRTVVAGTLFGLALLTKETTVFITFVPMVVLVVTGWLIPRVLSIRMLVTGTIVYLTYPIVIIAAGEGEELYNQKLRGVLRLLGIVQETGFNQEGAPTLGSRLTANLGSFLPTYTIIAMGGLAALWLLRRRIPTDRLFGIWTLCGFGLIGYAILFGTLEEQMFYLLVVPCLMAVCQLVHGWRGSLMASSVAHGLPAVVVGVLLIGSAWGVLVWVDVRSTPDNGYEELVAYMSEQVPPGSRVAATTDASVLVLERYEIGLWGDVEAVRENRAEYVVVSSNLVEQGYGLADQDFYQWLQGNALEVFRFTGPSEGDLSLFQIVG